MSEIKLESQQSSDPYVVLCHQTIDRLRRQLAEAQADTKRLDWLLDSHGERVTAEIWDVAARLCPWDDNEANLAQKWGRKAIDELMEPPKEKL